MATRFRLTILRIVLTSGFCLIGGTAMGQDPPLSSLSDTELIRRIAEAQAERDRRVSQARADIAMEAIAIRRAAEGRALLASLGEANPAAPPAQREADTNRGAAANPAQNGNRSVGQASSGEQPGNSQVQDQPANPTENQDANAQAPNTPGGNGQNANRNSQRQLADADTNKQEFGGIEFGIGMAFSHDVGQNDRVREAQLVNDTVRVTRGDNVRGRLILETHYLFTPPSRGLPFLGLMNPTAAQMRAGTPAEWGFGPFVAVQPGSDNIIDAIGGGIMLGLRRRVPGSDSFNIGIGILYDMDVQILGDGILENQPLPAGETEIRYRRDAQMGFMVMSSFTF